MLDGIVSDEGKNKNFNWDGVWFCSSKIDSAGWQAEVSIPFKTLRFKKEGSQIWGINFGRLIRRKNEIFFWTPVLRDYGMDPQFKVSKCGHLEGLKNLNPGRNLEFKPYILGKTRKGTEEDVDKADLGLDIKYSLTSNITLDLTYNTDFAQVESDQEQVNLTRFTLFYPEKREFFLEGAGIYQFGEKPNPYGDTPFALLFFSRRIGLAEGKPLPILGGIKVTGKEGKYNLALLNLQVKEAEVKDDENLYLIPSTNFTLVRVKRDIFSRSNFGLIFLNKETDLTESQKKREKTEPSTYISEDYESRYNRAWGIDLNLSLLQSLNAGGFLAKSYASDPYYYESYTSGQYYKGKDWAFGAYADFRNDLFNFEILHTQIQENFKSEMGFILREDIRRSKLNFGYSPRPKIKWIRQSFFFTDLEYYTDQNNLLLNHGEAIGVFNVLSNGGHLLFGIYRGYERLQEGDDFEIRDEKSIQPGTFSSQGFFSEFSSDESRRFSIDLGLNAGDFYNGKLWSLNSGNSFRITNRFSSNLSLNINWIKDLPVLDLVKDENERLNFTAKVIGHRMTYSFSTQLFLRSFLQWNSEDKELSLNFLINYIFEPGSNFYLVYNELWEREGSLKSKDRVILSKIVKRFSL